MVLINVLLVFFLILLGNLGVLPIKNLGNFVFFTFLLLLLALYRPGWSFLFFVGTIALENIIVSPPEFPIQLRPYQLLGALTIFAAAVRFIFKRLNFKLIKLNLADCLVICIAIATYVTAVFSADKITSFKQALVLTSFAALYFLVRNFIQSIDDLKKTIPFFLSSSVVVILYGIWQNVRFMHGLNSFEIMPGRPNSTLSEPDWFGIFLVLLLAVLYSLIYKISNSQFLISNQNPKFKIQNPKFYLFGCWLLIVGCSASLILTVSRSAWLGALIISIMYQALCIKHFIFDNKNWKGFFKQAVFIAVAVFTACFFVYVFQLTSFQLFNRFQSTGTGLQKITVSCKENIVLPEKVGYSEELIRYGCRHINLEEIKLEQMRGYYIKETYRNDPNVNIRSEIYQKSWNEIKEHPVFGIGWGSVGNILGKDERGTALNSSNIFLEVWLGSGILGMFAFLAIWVYILTRAARLFFKNNLEEKSVGLFLFLGAISLLIPNLFNAGIFMGMLWLFFGMSEINSVKKNTREV